MDRLPLQRGRIAGPLGVGSTRLASPDMFQVATCTTTSLFSPPAQLFAFDQSREFLCWSTVCILFDYEKRTATAAGTPFMTPASCRDTVSIVRGARSLSELGRASSGDREQQFV